jgi:hypothetical protein
MKKGHGGGDRPDYRPVHAASLLLETCIISLTPSASRWTEVANLARGVAHLTRDLAVCVRPPAIQIYSGLLVKIPEGDEVKLFTGEAV